MDLPHFTDGDSGVVREVILGLDRIWITWLLRPNHFFFVIQLFLFSILELKNRSLLRLRCVVLRLMELCVG